MKSSTFPARAPYLLVFWGAALSLTLSVRAETLSPTIQPVVVFGHKAGMALT